MARKVKYGKIAVVIFLTVLIWVWADLALDEEFSVSSATITVAKSTNPGLLVSFDDESSVSIQKLILKGPVSRIAEQKRKLKEGKRLEFDFDAAQENMDKPGSYTLRLLPFLRKDTEIKRLGLKVESCKPEILSVKVVELVKTSLAVRCVRQDQTPIKGATVEPRQVDMWVPKDWVGNAEVQLSGREIEQARVSAIEKRPYIVLAPGETRNGTTTVKIKLPPEKDRLSDYTITNAKLGFTLSANLQGEYKIKLTNPDAVMSAIAIRATPEAKRAYENMRYQVILEIDDSDKNAGSTEPLRKELIYNFPQDYVRDNKIKLNQQPVIARFKLTPLSPAGSP